MAHIGTDPETGVADALEGAFHVNALAVLTHSAGRTFVHIHAESIVSRRSKARLTDAMVGSWRILAAAIQTDSRIFHTLVDV